MGSESFKASETRMRSTELPCRTKYSPFSNPLSSSSAFFHDSCRVTQAELQALPDIAQSHLVDLALRSFEIDLVRHEPQSLFQAISLSEDSTLQPMPIRPKESSCVT